MPTLKEMRDEAILTQEELAQRVGVTKMTIYSWERGETGPRPAHIRKLAEVLGQDPKVVRAASLAVQKEYKAKQQAKERGITETWRGAAWAY